MRAKLSYANVMATLAMFVALGGSSYAAITITGKNVKNGSLTGADIKKNSLRGSDVRTAAVKSDDVRDGSLLALDFKSGQLPEGPKGDKGETGPKGETGTVDTSNFYDKAQSDARYLATTAKAADADTLDGLDASDFLRADAAAGGDLTGTYPNPTIAAGAVTGGAGGKIADDTITGSDISESTLDCGAIPGCSGISGYQRVSNAAVVPANSTVLGSVSCPAGTRVLGGGVTPTATLPELSLTEVASSFPSSDSTWSAGVTNRNGHSLTYTWWAICAAS